jgi:type IV secretion system protein VirB10
MSAEPGDAVDGERSTISVNRTLSAHSRMSSLLAMALMTTLGIGALAWYYANAFSRQARAREAAQVQSANRAQGDMALPAIGRIDPPAPAAAAPFEPPPGAMAPPAAAAPILLDEVPGPLLASATPGSGAAAPKSPAQIELERRLAGTVFAVQGGSIASGSVDTPTAAPAPVRPEDPESGKAVTGDLAPLLRAAASPSVRALVLPTQRLLLPKGAFIDCTLETAIDSTLPGMTTCILATDIFGADGKVVLLERGTKLVGETKGQVQQGAARVFVLWTEARTPTGVIVPLASPGADELGRSGLPGTVDRHFWQRFGAAMLVSVVNGAVQSAVQSSRGGGTVIYSPSASQDVMTEVLKSTVNIPPTVVKHQGDRISVLVARDLDFRSVYELRTLSVGR